MSIREVEDAIQKIRVVVEEWTAAGETEWMEEHTKYAVVDPIIRALGWDTASSLSASWFSRRCVRIV